MRRTAIRFVLVLAVFGGLLYFISRNDVRIGGKESPSVITGPLGDAGSPLPRSGSRRLRVTPVRDVVIRQLAELPSVPGGQFFQPIAELHGSSVEYRADEVQVIKDALFVREMDGSAITDAAERRAIFQEILAYDAAGRSSGVTAPTDPKRRLTHVRIAASHAEMEGFDGAAPRIRFYGGPPDGVQITAFDERGEPVIEFRSEFLVAEQKDRDDNVELAITSPKRVHFFSPDDRYRLSGTGIRGHFIRPRARRADARPRTGALTESLGVFVLQSDIRLEAPEGVVALRPPKKNDRPRKKATKKKDDAKATRWKHSGVFTCDGPALLRVRRVEQPAQPADSKKPKADMFVDSLELLGRVHGHHESTEYEGEFIASHSIQNLDADRVRVWITRHEIRSAIATGNVVASLNRRTPIGGPQSPKLDAAETEEFTATVRCQRARLAFENRAPQWVRAYAWSARTVKFGADPWGPWCGAVPLYEPPEVVGKFQTRALEGGHFRAKCRREIVIERKPRKKTGRITLLDHVEVDFQGVGRTDKRDAVAKTDGAPSSGAARETTENDADKKSKKKKKAPSWLPGFSGLTARDKVVIDHFGRPKRLLDFAAEGDVRFETVLGKMKADRLSGTVVDENEWRVEADGYPVLDLPIMSRSSGRLESVLRALTLERAGPTPRASETAGRIRVEGTRAVFEMQRSPDKKRSSGAARFSEAVKVTLQEASSIPIRLFCRDLRFRFDQLAGDKSATTSEVVADDDVIIDAGDNVRASGDRLVFDRTGDATRGGLLTGYPARLRVVDRNGRTAIIEGQTIAIDRSARRATARTGAFARFYPSHDTRFSIPGAETGTVSLEAVELHANVAEIEWREGRSLSAFRAFEAVRIRGYDRAEENDGEALGRLVQWVDAEELHYELSAKNEAGRVQRTLRLVGEADNPVRIGYRDPLAHSGEDDYRLDVPVIVITGASDRRLPESVTGYGAGRIRLRSQDNVFGSKTSGGPRRDELIELQFRNGFTMRAIDSNRSRLDFPDGGELTSRKRDGTVVAHMIASKTLALRLNTAKRKNDSDLRVIDSGLAEGDVKVRIRGDTTGGADALTWDRGTNTVIMTGNPAWIEKPEGASTGRQITYNISTRRVRVTDFAGRLRRKFERKEESREPGGG